MSARPASLAGAPTEPSRDRAPRKAPAASLVGLGIGKAAPGSRVRAAKKGDITADLRRLGVMPVPGDVAAGMEPAVAIPVFEPAEREPGSEPAREPPFDAPDGYDTAPDAVDAPPVDEESLQEAPADDAPPEDIAADAIAPEAVVPDPVADAETPDDERDEDPDAPAESRNLPFAAYAPAPPAPLGWSGPEFGAADAAPEEDGSDGGAEEDAHAAYAAFDALIAAWEGPQAPPADDATSGDATSGDAACEETGFEEAGFEETVPEPGYGGPAVAFEDPGGDECGDGSDVDRADADRADVDGTEAPLLLDTEAEDPADPEPSPEPEPEPEPVAEPDRPAGNPVAGLRARIEAAVAAARRSDGHGGREAGSAGAGDGFARKPSPARRAVSAPQRAAAATVAKRANLVARPPEALIRHWVERRGRDPLPAWEAFDPREITAQWPNTLLLTLDPDAPANGDAASAFAGIVRLDRADRPQPAGVPTIVYTPSLTDWILGLAREAARGGRLARDADEFVTPGGRLSLSAIALPLGRPDGRVTQVLCHLAAA